MPATPHTADPDALLIVGRTGKPHGVMGELKVIPETDDPDRIEALETLYLGSTPDSVQPYGVDSVRYQQTKHGLTVIVHLDGITDRDAASALRGQSVFAHEDDLPPLEDGEYYLHDLIGLSVRLESGDEIGKVADVMELPGHEVLVVARPGQPKAMIPAVPEFIDELDLEAGFLVVRPIEGLLDL